MWDFPGAEGLQRFLIIGHGDDGVEAVRDELVARRGRYLWDGDISTASSNAGRSCPTMASGGGAARCSWSFRTGARWM